MNLLLMNLDSLTNCSIFTNTKIMAFRKTKKSRFQREEVAISVIINHFMNLLKPVQRKDTITFNMLKRKHLQSVDEETKQMLKSGFVFQADIKKFQSSKTITKTFSVKKEKVKRPRIIHNPIKIQENEYGEFVN